MLALPRFVIRWATWPIRAVAYGLFRVILRALRIY